MWTAAILRRFAAGLAAALATSSVLYFAACSPSPETPATPVQSYAMRGEIVRLPVAGSREIAIRHEAVPDFRDEAGKVVGMEAMTMPFALAPDLPTASLEGLAPGDRIAFTLEMRWQDPREIARISHVEKLPSGTPLAWDEPPAATPKTPAAPQP